MRAQVPEWKQKLSPTSPYGSGSGCRAQNIWGLHRVHEVYRVYKAYPKGPST